VIAFLRECFDFGVYAFKAMPEGAWPLIVGLLFSFAFTHRMKRRLRPELSEQRRHSFTESIAFWSGFASTWVLWAMATDTPLQRTYGGFAAFIVGAASPLMWKFFVWAIAKKCPDLRDRLSGDKKP
jgi:hypothetical protein